MNINIVSAYTSEDIEEILESIKEDYNSSIDKVLEKHLKAINIILDETERSDNVFSIYLSDDITVARRRSVYHPIKVMSCRYNDRSLFRQFTKKYIPVPASESTLKFLHDRHRFSHPTLREEVEGDISIEKSRPECVLQ